MTKGQMLAEISEKTGLTKKDVTAVLDIFTDTCLKVLKKDKKVKLPGLGIFSVKNRKARMGRNPMTGESIKIPAKKVVKFRVAKDVKDKVL